MPIYTIAYGTANGYIEIGGRREPVPVDRDELERIARISGGEAYTATSAGELKDVYQDIGSSVGKEKVDREVTSRYAGFGLRVRHPRRAGADLPRRALAVGADSLGPGPSGRPGRGPVVEYVVPVSFLPVPFQAS